MRVYPRGGSMIMRPEIMLKSFAIDFERNLDIFSGSDQHEISILVLFNNVDV